ncbi:MAG: DinB family protein [Melioribacteraceae bacterium]
MSLVKTVGDFLASWKYESESTLKVFANLTDESLNQKVTEEGRSLGFLAWHITQTIGEMMSKAGLSFEDFDENAAVPVSAEQIKSEYEKLSSKMSSQVEKDWNDNMLDDDLNMYGQTWKRGDVLASLLAHQTHHRGQMTVLMRQAGLKVPGVYGPSKEEWATYGMEPLP